MKEDNIIAKGEFIIEDIYQVENINKVDEIISFKIEPSVENFKIINIKEGKNTSGEVFLGKRIVIDVSLKINLKYNANNSSRILFEEKENKNYIYINCAKEVQGINIEEIKRKRKIKIQMSNKKIKIKKLDGENILFKVLGKVELIKI